MDIFTAPGQGPNGERMRAEECQASGIGEFPKRIDTVAGVNYLDRPATTILAGWKRGMISL